MRINFFEEFPIEENLAKAKMIDFPSTVFIAAHSLEEFKKFKARTLEINPNLEIAYWPLVPRTYWISPFSYTKDLKNFVNEMKTNKDPLTILVDLELPLAKRAYLYFRNFFSFFINKRIIKKFFKEAKKYNIQIVTADYATASLRRLKFYRRLGISYDPKKYGHRCCVMYYTSMISDVENVSKTIVKVKKEINPDLELGLGAIAIGIMGNEPILSPENLDRDLKFMKDNGFDTATIFRMGGLDERYIEVIKRHIG